VTSEPDMEGLLASIRKAINTDMGIAGPSQDGPRSSAPPLRGSVNELRVKFDTDFARSAGQSAEISELRNKINRNRTADIITRPAPRFESTSSTSPSRKGFEEILAGDLAKRNQHLTQEPDELPRFHPTVYEAEPVISNYSNYDEPGEYVEEPAWEPAEQNYLPAIQYDEPMEEDYSAPTMLSDESALAANQSFNQLADTLMARALGERSIEDMTHDLLRGMLKSWLDTNLPTMVERLVREEIERVARRGR
jgi:uncharacterized protein